MNRIDRHVPAILMALILVLLGWVAPSALANEPEPLSDLRVPLAQAGTEWLEHLNAVRALAGAPPVASSEEWSSASAMHARYMVKNDELTHSETEGNPWHSPEGAAAAAASNVWVSSQSELTPTTILDHWLAAPFHGIAMLDPQLTAAGYGDYREEDGGIEFAAALDVQRGITTTLPPTDIYPILYPADGSTVSVNSFNGAEYPDPLSSCPGFTPPLGAPIYLQLGHGDSIPRVGTHIVSANGKMVPHCVLDETSYTHPDLYQESVGRVILDMRDAVVLLPESPIPPGARVRVAVSANGRVHKWSFEIAEDAPPVPDALATP